MIRTKNLLLTYLLPFLALCGYLFLYIPIIILVLFSFNSSEVPFVWEGFSLKWYYALWQSSAIWQALQNSLIVAFSTVFLSLVMGVLFVFYGARTVLGKFSIMFYASLATPEIVLAVGLLSLLSFFAVPLGLPALIAGHTLIGLGYVVPILQARYQELDKRYLEAALDLGATEGMALRKVMVPLLMPALLASALLVFVLSLDDFIISFFCSGGTTQTLPIYIFVMIRSGASPIVNALSTMLLIISSLLVLLFSSLKIKKTDLLQ
jgi:spermidine/putrescine transport system permease protein